MDQERAKIVKLESEIANITKDNSDLLDQFKN